MDRGSYFLEEIYFKLPEKHFINYDRKADCRNEKCQGNLNHVTELSGKCQGFCFHGLVATLSIYLQTVENDQWGWCI